MSSRTEVFDSLREDAPALLEGFDTHQLAAIAQFLTRATDFAYRRAALLRAQVLSAGGPTRAAANPTSTTNEELP